MSSPQWWKLSTASMAGSDTKLPGAFSSTRQSLLALPPSVWRPDVDAPQRKSGGMVNDNSKRHRTGMLWRPSAF